MYFGQAVQKAFYVHVWVNVFVVALQISVTVCQFKYQIEIRYRYIMPNSRKMGTMKNN